MTKNFNKLTNILGTLSVCLREAYKQLGLALASNQPAKETKLKEAWPNPPSSVG